MSVQPNEKTVQFSTRTAPWMKLGTIIDRDDVTAAEAAELGGLNFTVSLRSNGWREGASDDGDDGDAAPDGLLSADQLAALATDADKRSGDNQAMRALGRHVPDLLKHIAALSGGTDRAGRNWHVIPNRLAVVRDDTHVALDVVSDDYVPVQYAESFAFLDAVPGVRHVAAGTLRGGRQGFMVVQVPGTAHLDIQAGDGVDPHDLYAVVRSSHDRSRALEVFLMPLRSKCMNQMPLASFGDGALQRWSVRHVGDPLAKLEQAGKIIENSTEYAISYAKMVKQLAETDVLLEDAERVLKTVLKDLPKRDEQISAITTAWRSSPNVDLGSSAWGLVNGVSEYFEWQRNFGTRTRESLFTAALDGMTGRYVRRTAQVLMRHGAR